MNRNDIIRTIATNLDKKLNVLSGRVSYVGYVSCSSNTGIRMEKVEAHSWKGDGGITTVSCKWLNYQDIDRVHVCVKYPEPEAPKPPHEAVFGRGPIKGTFRCGGAKGQTDQGLLVEIVDPYNDSQRSVVIRFGDPGNNMPLFINKKTCGILKAFFTDMEKYL